MQSIALAVLWTALLAGGMLVKGEEVKQNMSVGQNVKDDALAVKDVADDALAVEDVAGDALAEQDVAEDALAEQEVADDALAVEDVADDALAVEDIANDDLDDKLSKQDSIADVERKNMETSITKETSETITPTPQEKEQGKVDQPPSDNHAPIRPKILIVKVVKVVFMVFDVVISLTRLFLTWLRKFDRHGRMVSTA